MLDNPGASRVRGPPHSDLHSDEGQYDLGGRAAYYLEPDAGLIACVVRTTTSWLTTHVAGTANGEGLPRVRDAVLDILEANGVPCFRPLPEDAADVGLRAYSPWHLGALELDDLDGMEVLPI